MKCFQDSRKNVEAKAAVVHRSAHHRHRRTQSVLKRSPPHPSRLTGALKQKLPVDPSLAQGKTVDALRTATSYFDMGWNAFVGIGEDFHSQVEDATRPVPDVRATCLLPHVRRTLEVRRTWRVWRVPLERYAERVGVEEGVWALSDKAGVSPLSHLCALRLVRCSATMRGHSETMPVAHVKPDRHVPAALGAALGAGLHRGALPPRPHPATRSSTSWCPIHKKIDKQNCVLTNKIAKPNLTNLLKRHVELRAKPHAALKAHAAWKLHAASSKPLNPCEQNLSILTASVCFAARCGWRHTRSARIACASMRELYRATSDLLKQTSSACTAAHRKR